MTDEEAWLTLDVSLFTPSRIDGHFWCAGGSYYMIVGRHQITRALWILTQMAAPVRA